MCINHLELFIFFYNLTDVRYIFIGSLSHFIFLYIMIGFNVHTVHVML